MSPVPRPHLFLFPVFLLAALLGTVPASAVSERTGGLRKALAVPGAVRSVFFVRGMSCRACTLLMDRHLNRVAGVFWGRFNYPLRLLVVYHDSKYVSTAALEEFVNRSGELGAEIMRSTLAGEVVMSVDHPVARWKGGSLTFEEARVAPQPFEGMIEEYMIDRGTEMWVQVVYEIAGEEARNRILRARASAAGYEAGGAAVDIPTFIAKDFYWPVELMPPTPEEAAVSRFLRERVISDDEEEKGRGLFDEWLLELWREIELDFRGEILELQETEQ